MLYFEQNGAGTGPAWCWHLLQADIHPCPGDEVGQIELSYPGPAHAEDVALARVV